MRRGGRREEERGRERIGGSREEREHGREKGGCGAYLTFFFPIPFYFDTS